jgi:hypothetical protein
MSPDEPNVTPKHRSLELTPERDLAARHRVARSAIIIYFVTLLASSVVACDCPSFFVVMAVCAIVAIVCGSRFQRILSAVLLPVALAGIIIGFRQELHHKQRMMERVRHLKELDQQRNQNQ